MKSQKFWISAILCVTLALSACSNTGVATTAASTSSNSAPSTAISSSAADSSDPSGSAGPTDDRPPDTGGQFAPVPREQGSLATEVKQGCGTTLTYAQGDKYGAIDRITHTPDGGFTVEGKDDGNGNTADVTAADGRKIDEIDNSGSFLLTARQDHTSTIVAQGPQLYIPRPEETPGFAAKGIPIEGVYWTTGQAIVDYNADGSVKDITEIPTWTSICDLLK